MIYQRKKQHRLYCDMFCLSNKEKQCNQNPILDKPSYSTCILEVYVIPTPRVLKQVIKIGRENIVLTKMKTPFY